MKKNWSRRRCCLRCSSRRPDARRSGTGTAATATASASGVCCRPSLLLQVRGVVTVAVLSGMTIFLSTFSTQRHLAVVIRRLGTDAGCRFFASAFLAVPESTYRRARQWIPLRRRRRRRHPDYFPNGSKNPTRPSSYCSASFRRLTTILQHRESRAEPGDDVESPILRDLNPSQIEAVTQPLEAITRVVAGPGSGKTRVLTSRIAHVLEKDNRNRVLGVTFTRKAAGEMQQRLHNLLLETAASSTTNDDIVDGEDGSASPYPRGIDRVTLGTFHSISAKMLRWNGDRLSSLPSVVRDMTGSRNPTVLDGSFAIIDEGDQLRLLRECLEDAGIDLGKANLKPRPVMTALSECRELSSRGVDPLQHIASAMSSSKRGENTPRVSKAMEVAAKVYYLYREKILSRNCLDFNDLMYLARELLINHPDVRESLQRRWTHVLVDEFQDTSRTQMDLVKLLTSSSLLVVGDADQSIYSWRGAHVGSLSDFEGEFEGFLGEVTTIYLMENYRYSVAWCFRSTWFPL